MTRKTDSSSSGKPNPRPLTHEERQALIRQPISIQRIGSLSSWCGAGAVTDQDFMVSRVWNEGTGRFHLTVGDPIIGDSE